MSSKTKIPEIQDIKGLLEPTIHFRDVNPFVARIGVRKSQNGGWRSSLETDQQVYDYLLAKFTTLFYYLCFLQSMDGSETISRSKE